jgi:hypothetical protein
MIVDIKGETKKNVEVIVLSFNALFQLGYCLKSLKECNNGLYSITVIDNASTDGTAEWLKHQKGIKTVFNQKNKLFTVAYQDYLRKDMDAEYFVIMNNDCIVEPNWCEHLQTYMIENKDCGISAPMLLDVSGRQVQNMGGLNDFCSHKGGVPENWKNPEENTWTTFACVMIRKEAFIKIRGFDEQFLFYCSDSDMCLRMILNGYKVINLPASKVRHFHMASTQENKEVMKIGADDQRKFQVKWEFCGIGIGKNKPLFKDNFAMLEG